MTTIEFCEKSSKDQRRALSVCAVAGVSGVEMESARAVQGSVFQANYVGLTAWKRRRRELEPCHRPHTLNSKHCGLGFTSWDTRDRFEVRIR